MLLHTEKGFVRPLDAGEDTADVETEAEEEGEHLEDRTVDDKHLVHHEHEYDEGGADGAPGDERQHHVGLRLVPPKNPVQHELDQTLHWHLQFFSCPSILF